MSTLYCWKLTAHRNVLVFVEDKRCSFRVHALCQVFFKDHIDNSDRVLYVYFSHFMHCPCFMLGLFTVLVLLITLLY